MLSPTDYGEEALNNTVTRKLMEKVEFQHGGKEYDSKYPEGIPTSVQITTKDGKVYDSGLIMFPGGHARNTDISLSSVLQYKNNLLGKIGLGKQELIRFVVDLNNIQEMSNE